MFIQENKWLWIDFVKKHLKTQGIPEDRYDLGYHQGAPCLYWTYPEESGVRKARAACFWNVEDIDKLIPDLKRDLGL